MPTIFRNHPIEMEEEDVFTCVQLCMEVGQPRPTFNGSLKSEFPGRVVLCEGPLKTIQELWRKYYTPSDTLSVPPAANDE